MTNLSNNFSWISLSTLSSNNITPLNEEFNTHLWISQMFGEHPFYPTKDYTQASDVLLHDSSDTSIIRTMKIYRLEVYQSNYDNKYSWELDVDFYDPVPYRSGNTYPDQISRNRYTILPNTHTYGDPPELIISQDFEGGLDTSGFLMVVREIGDHDTFDYGVYYMYLYGTINP